MPLSKTLKLQLMFVMCAVFSVRFTTLHRNSLKKKCVRESRKCVCVLHVLAMLTNPPVTPVEILFFFKADLIPVISWMYRSDFIFLYGVG